MRLESASNSVTASPCMSRDKQSDPGRPPPLGLLRAFSHFHVGLYRLTRLVGDPSCLLTMTGAKSGRRRTLPLMYIPHGDAVILVASVLTSYAKARAELVVDHMPGGLLERGERVGLLALGAILGFIEPVLWFLAFGTVVTVGQRFLYAYREMERLDAEERG